MWTLLLWLVWLWLVATAVQAATGKMALTDETLHQAVRDWHHPSERTTVLLKYGPIALWDTSNVTDMGSLFYKAEHFDDDLSRWDTSRVTNMEFMFFGASSFTGRRRWDYPQMIWNTSAVQNMHNMFAGATAVVSLDGLGLSHWDVSQVTTMNSMFQEATHFQGDLSKWNTLHVQDLTSMLEDAKALTTLDVRNWNIDRVTAMDAMLYGTHSLTSQICFGGGNLSSQQQVDVTTAWHMMCCTRATWDANCRTVSNRRQAQSTSCSSSGASSQVVNGPSSKSTCPMRIGNPQQYHAILGVLSCIVILSGGLLLVFYYIPWLFLQDVGTQWYHRYCKQRSSAAAARKRTSRRQPPPPNANHPNNTDNIMDVDNVILGLNIAATVDEDDLHDNDHGEDDEGDHLEDDGQRPPPPASTNATDSNYDEDERLVSHC